jgi:hypothetical protein
MFMEEIIASFAEATPMSFLARDRQFIRSINARIERGEPLTTRQGYAFMRLLTNTTDIRHALGLSEVQFCAVLKNPEWRTPLKPSVWLKNEVRYMGNDVLGFRCTPSKEMEAELTTLKATYYGGLRLAHHQGSGEHQVRGT